jgi:uncharacterized protein (TIGR03437 family)
MNKILTTFTLILLLCAAGGAATTSTTLTVDASGALDASFTSFKATGTATLSGIGNGTFTTTLNLSSITGANVTAPYTITLSGGTITGNITLPATVFGGGSATANGSATVTGGTGTYAGATGSFPTLTGTATGAITSTITLHFSGAGSITTGGTGGGGGGGTSGTGTSNSTTITDVLDAGSYTKNIAQGSIFVVKGTNLSASGFTQASFPLPTTLAGVSITVGSTAAYMIYDYNQSGVNQLAAVLPSTITPGNYTLTVKNNTGDAATTQITVVQRKPGIITQDSTGSGLGVVQNFVSQSQLDIDRFTVGSISGITISPAHPGQVLIAWLTGLGPVSGSENTASPGHDFLADGVDIQVIVGTSRIKPLYAGRAPGLAGADQVNFVLPADVQTGCTVPFQVSVAGQLSNPSFIAIASNASANACDAPGFTTAQLQNFDQGNSMTVGSFTLSQSAITVPQFGSVKTNSISGGFVKITGFQLTSAARYTATPTNGCQVLHVHGTQADIAVGGTVNFLDAGTVTLTGPNGSNLTGGVTVTKSASNAYSLSLGTEGLGVSLPGSVNATLVAGNYALKGAGGADVGAFNTSVNLGSPLTITGGLPASVNRAGGLTLNWTGGNSSDLVTILGYSGTSTGTGANAVTDATEFFCTTTAGKGGFTVPSDVLSQLPAVSQADIDAGKASGFLSVSSSSAPSNFTAPLTKGGSIDSGVFAATVGTAALVSYQ